MFFRRLHARSFVEIKAQNCEQIILMEKRLSKDENFFHRLLTDPR